MDEAKGCGCCEASCCTEHVPIPDWDEVPWPQDGDDRWGFAAPSPASDESDVPW